MTRNWDTAFELAKQVEAKVDELIAAWPASYDDSATKFWRDHLDELAAKARGLRSAAGAGIDIEAQRRRDENTAECTTEASCEAGDHTYTWPCELAFETGRLWKEYNA